MELDCIEIEICENKFPNQDPLSELLLPIKEPTSPSSSSSSNQNTYTTINPMKSPKQNITKKPNQKKLHHTPTPTAGNPKITHTILSPNFSHKYLSCFDKLYILEMIEILIIATLLLSLHTIYAALFHLPFQATFYQSLIIIGMLQNILLFWCLYYRSLIKAIKNIPQSKSPKDFHYQLDNHIPQRRLYAFYIYSVYLFNKSIRLLFMILLIFHIKFEINFVIPQTLGILSAIPELLIFIQFEELGNVRIFYKIVYSSWNLQNITQLVLLFKWNSENNEYYEHLAYPRLLAIPFIANLLIVSSFRSWLYKLKYNEQTLPYRLFFNALFIFLFIFEQGVSFLSNICFTIIILINLSYFFLVYIKAKIDRSNFSKLPYKLTMFDNTNMTSIHCADVNRNGTKALFQLKDKKRQEPYWKNYDCIEKPKSFFELWLVSFIHEAKLNRFKVKQKRTLNIKKLPISYELTDVFDKEMNTSHFEDIQILERNRFLAKFIDYSRPQLLLPGDDNEKNKRIMSTLFHYGGSSQSTYVAKFDGDLKVFKPDPNYSTFLGINCDGKSQRIVFHYPYTTHCIDNISIYITSSRKKLLNCKKIFRKLSKNFVDDVFIIENSNFYGVITQGKIHIYDLLTRKLSYLCMNNKDHENIGFCYLKEKRILFTVQIGSTSTIDRFTKLITIEYIINQYRYSNEREFVFQREKTVKFKMHINTIPKHFLWRELDFRFGANYSSCISKRINLNGICMRSLSTDGFVKQKRYDLIIRSFTEYVLVRVQFDKNLKFVNVGYMDGLYESSHLFRSKKDSSVKLDRLVEGPNNTIHYISNYSSISKIDCN